MATVAETTDAVGQPEVESRYLGTLPAAEPGVEQFGGPLTRVFTGAPGEPPTDAAARFLSHPTLSHPANGPFRSIALKRAQQMHGNHFVQRAIVQRKPNSSQTIQRQCACGGTCSSCQASRNETTNLASNSPVQAQVNYSSTSNQSGKVHLDLSGGQGEPLAKAPRTLMESRFGQDFGDVRVHTDDSASGSAEALNANAYTSGRDIYFARGKYQPDSLEGQRLLAHELVHTVQQGEGGPALSSAQQISQPGDPFEVEADRTADAVVAGGHAAHLSLSATLIARDIDPAEQKKKEARYSSWVRFALTGPLTDQREGINDFVAELLELAAVALDDTEFATFERRANELAHISVDRWDLVTAPRLIAAISGLPKELAEDVPSIGTESFLADWVRTIVKFLAAPDQDAEKEYRSDLINAVAMIVTRFGSVASLLSFELNDTLGRLIDLREDLNEVRDDPGMKPEDNLARRRAIGEELNRTARHALLLNQALGDKALTSIPFDPSLNTPLETQLGPLRGCLDQMRATEGTEKATQKQLGMKPERLAPLPLGRAEVQPEEAFPETTDEAAELWTKSLADRASELYQDALNARNKIIPATPPSTIEGFGEIFDRWFTFLPSRAIKSDPYIAQTTAAWREVSEALTNLGFEGWMANQLLKPVGYSVYGALAQPKEWSPFTNAKLRDKTIGPGVIPSYAFVHELQREGGDIETHAENRQIALEQGITQSTTSFSALWALQEAKVSPLGMAQGMNLAPSSATYLFLRDPELAKGWHYLLFYQSIVDESYQVSEHKTMEGPVADYLGATVQLQSMFASTHQPKSDWGVPLGEKAIRQGGIESAEGRSQARFGLTSQPANPRVEVEKAAYNALKEKFKRGPMSAQSVVDGLEQVMSDALKQSDDNVFRIGSVLHMSWREHDLEDTIKEFFKPAVLAEAVLKALAIGLALKALSMLGPIGRLLSTTISEILRKSGGSTLGMVLSIVSWIDDARRVESFGAARAQAFFAVDVVKALTAFVQDKLVGGIANRMRKWGNPERWAPKTTRDVTDAVKKWLSPDQIPQALAEVRSQRERLEKMHGPDHPEVKALKAIEADLGGTHPGEAPPAPVPLEKTSLETRLKDVEAAAQKVGLDPTQAVAAERAKVHSELKKAVEDAMGPVKPGETAPVIEVVPSDQIGPAGTKRAARVVVENGKVTKVLIDENASKTTAHEEGIHVAQSKDPAMAKLFAKLDPGKPWADMTPKEKLDATKAAMQIEIDAKKRMAEQLETDQDPRAGDELIRAYEDIQNLRAKQLELAQIKPRKLDKAELPDILSEPAMLYSKKTKASLDIDGKWSKGTFSEFMSKFEAANPDHKLTQREIESLYKREKRALNPDRAIEASEQYDVAAELGTKESLLLKTTGKRAEDTALVTERQRTQIDKLLEARNRARRQRNDALENNDESAYKRHQQKVVDASQKLGEQAADIWAKQRAWKEGARPTRVYGGEGSRSGDFDRVDKWVDQKGVTRYLVIEAKGGEGKLGGKWYGDKYVQQGSKDYFLATLDDMSNSSSPQQRKAAAQLRAVLTTGKDLQGNKAEIDYEMVQLPVELVDAPRTKMGEKSVVEEIEVTPFKL